MDENTKKKILKILSKAKKENPENPAVSCNDLEDELNMEDHELDVYIRDLKYRGYIKYDGSRTYDGQDVTLTDKGEKIV